MLDKVEVKDVCFAANARSARADTWREMFVGDADYADCQAAKTDGIRYLCSWLSGWSSS